ncbi:zinc-dependent alcohol dehydrogenase family protein [Salinicola corii]|uniref:Zinc-dependent alcohol dehydrogenase family protein n=1 Tax=Salinicola corii TaxID=2606937 RepID=A0A640WJ24_9GAMM|nr:zinc-dependent alcohol dehydrogenase family protein [Salinicola corii]KAA0020643.1 zinc-dependent alcohol dehydrogenase family protein [Salinicola corii]
MSVTVRIVRFHETGPSDVLKVETVPLPEPAAGEVRIRVKAIGLNRAEVMWREGSYLIQPDLPAQIGFEAAGDVEAIGPDVESNWLGKRVSNMPSFSPNMYGAYGDVAILPVHALSEIPDTLSYEQGTAIWAPYLTAYGSLVRIGHLDKNDTVLITAASSSTGLAAIQIVNTIGAQAIATTRKADKKGTLLAAGADHVIVTSEEDLVERIVELTEGKGARLIYDPVAGPGLESLARAAAIGGTIFEYGLLSPAPTPYPLRTALLRQLTIRAYDAAPEMFQTPTARKEGKAWLLKQISEGRISPIIDKSKFKLCDIASAHDYMESNTQFGKIVLTP